MSDREHVLVVGHPYVDVWQSIKPDRLGLEAWPVIPRGTDWKHGICEALGWPHADQADIARAWKHLLSRVDSYADLEPSFLGRVEELIDFVTGCPSCTSQSTSSRTTASASSLPDQRQHQVIVGHVAEPARHQIGHRAHVRPC